MLSALHGAMVAEVATCVTVCRFRSPDLGNWMIPAAVALLGWVITAEGFLRYTTVRFDEEF